MEQRRREKAKLYFDELRALLPCGADSKFDKNTILQNTIAMIKQLQAELDCCREAKLGGKRPLATSPGSGDYRTSFDVTRQPLCFCGLDGCVWESNNAFCNLMGYTKQVRCTHSSAPLSCLATHDAVLGLSPSAFPLSFLDWHVALEELALTRPLSAGNHWPFAAEQHGPLRLGRFFAALAAPHLVGHVQLCFLLPHYPKGLATAPGQHGPQPHPQEESAILLPRVDQPHIVSQP